MRASSARRAWNLLKGRPAESDRGLVIDLGRAGITPPVREDLAHSLRRANGEIFYGFRPERTALSLDGKGLPLPVTFVERIGARTIIHLGEGESEIKTVFDNDVGLSMGESASIVPNAEAVCAFDVSERPRHRSDVMADIIFHNVTKRYGA